MYTCFDSHRAHAWVSYVRGRRRIVGDETAARRQTHTDHIALRLCALVLRHIVVRKFAATGAESKYNRTRHYGSTNILGLGSVGVDEGNEFDYVVVTCVDVETDKNIDSICPKNTEKRARGRNSLF